MTANGRDYDSRYERFTEAQVVRMMTFVWRKGQPNPPTFADRLEAVRRLAREGLSDAQIAERIGRSARQVQRMRHRWNIRGLPKGTNAATRPVMPQVWVKAAGGGTTRKPL